MAFERAEVVCPFYRHDDGVRRLVCEGVSDTTTLSQHFRGKRQMGKYMERYCFHDCTDCEIFSMLMRSKYADL